MQDELLLRNIQIDGSPAQPPINVTTAAEGAGAVRASPYISIASATLRAPLDRQYEGPIGGSMPEFQTVGLRWNLPDLTYGLDVDFTVTNALAFTAGIAGSVGQGRQFFAYYGGVGFYSAGPETGLRLDLGLRLSDVEYTGATVALRTVDSVPADTFYYLDRGSAYHLNLYGSLTVNSAREDWPVNWFVQLAITPQTLTAFVPRNQLSSIRGLYIVDDRRAESSVFWASVTPGVVIDVPDVGRLLLGARVLKEIQARAHPSVLLIPTVQLDWRL